MRKARQSSAPTTPVSMSISRYSLWAFVSTIDEIKLSGDTAAEILVTVAMAGKNEGTFGLSADAYRFELELESVNSEWLLIGARWGELGHDLR